MEFNWLEFLSNIQWVELIVYGAIITLLLRIDKTVTKIYFMLLANKNK